MQTLTSVEKLHIHNNNKRVSIPKSLNPNKVLYTNTELADFKDFISSQHPLINVWLGFSLLSIGILSILLYLI